MNAKTTLSNEDIVQSIRERLKAKNKKIAELEETVTKLQKSLSATQKDVENRDKLFEMLSEILGEEG